MKPNSIPDYVSLEDALKRFVPGLRENNEPLALLCPICRKLVTGANREAVIKMGRCTVCDHTDTN